ncbi:cobalamin biosynthesis protein [Streptomyces sp. NPDC051776]|uniref:cobalamin biosynthesis protein n=1 Tax=Streptomyces sp. NPDC051776 TaxID=3155414 RepID=UPI00343B891D
MCLTVGVGASRGVGEDEVLDLIRCALAEAGLSERPVTALATVDSKADETGLVDAARKLGVGLRTYAAEALAGVDVPNPSGAAQPAIGTPSVAEAAALLAAGEGAELLVPKRKSAPKGRPAKATVAVAGCRPDSGAALSGAVPGARGVVSSPPCDAGGR